jgi:FAD/FMN-containing dehydrogenase
MPRAIAVPADAADVVTLVKWAAQERIPLTPRGSGSSMANGAIGAGVIVDLSKLNEMGPVDAKARTLTVGPGVTRDAVEAVAVAARLTFPVDPSSSAFATIGGMCATNAAGASTVRHGAMRRWVNGLDCVFADGTRAFVRRGEKTSGVPAIQRFIREASPSIKSAGAAAFRLPGVRKQSSGYGLAEWCEGEDLVDVIVGSEGTLAIIVGVELKLAPRVGGRAGLVAGFPDLEGAAAAAGRLTAAGASAVEMLDRTFLEIAASGGDPLPIALPHGLEAVLIIAVEDISEGAAADRLPELTGWCEAGGALFIQEARDEATNHRIWRLRHAASPILNRLAPRLQSMQLVEDGCVPPACFAEYVRGVRRALRAARFQGVIFGHAGDGHAHVNALIDVKEPDWRARAELLMRDVTNLVASLGGTLAGEHGDGRLRAPLMSRIWSPTALAGFAATKNAFDPDGILNPGVIIAAAGSQALEQVKYDPALPPLPPYARAALDKVVRDKAWNTHRLSLL